MALYFFDHHHPLLESSRPSRILNQHFGLDLDPEDLLAPLIPREVRRLMSFPSHYLRPWASQASQQDVGSTVSFDNNQFQANLDVQQFAPEEISVKVTDDNTITIEGKHEEKKDEHGYISRQFVRKYVIPKTHDISKVESSLSSDGVLSITAPKIDDDAIEHRKIPITQTGAPSKPAIAKKAEGAGDKKKK